MNCLEKQTVVVRLSEAQQPCRCVCMTGDCMSFASKFSLCLVILAFCASTSALADITTGFEIGDPTPLYRTGGAGSSNQDCTLGDPVHSGSCSAQLYLPDDVQDAAAAGIVWDGPLSAIYSSVWGYVPSTSPQLFPYLDYYVDSNQDGTIESVGDPDKPDSLVILDQSPTFSPNTWVYEVLNGDSLVHVYGNRPGLADGTFTPGDPGTLDALLATALPGGGTWGDLIVMRARAEAGSWGCDNCSGGPSYTAYVDNLTVGTVPEPGALVCLATVVAFLAARRKLFA